MARDPRFRYFTELDDTAITNFNATSYNPHYTTEPSRGGVHSSQSLLRNISPRKDFALSESPRQDYLALSAGAGAKAAPKSRNAIFDEDDSPVFPSSKLDDLQRQDSERTSRNLYSTRSFENGFGSTSSLLSGIPNGVGGVAGTPNGSISSVASTAVNGSRRSLFVPVVKDTQQPSSFHSPPVSASFCTSPVTSQPPTPSSRSRKSSTLSIAGGGVGAHVADTIPLGDKVIYFPTRKNFIASGRFADVYRGTCGLDVPCAVKRLHRTEESVDRAVEEARILRRVNGHPNIVRLYKVFNETKGQVHEEGDHVEPDSQLCIALELYPGGTIWDFSQSKPEQVGSRMWMRWAKQLLSAVRHLEKLGVVHYDIKPHNILLDDLQVAKLSDFGSARLISTLPRDTHSKRDSHLSISAPSFTGIGTTAYTPPELLTEPTTNSYVGVDIYSLCATLWVVGILGHDPFKSVSNPVYMIMYIRAGFLDSGLNWPDAHAHEGREPPSGSPSPLHLPQNSQNGPTKHSGRLAPAGGGANANSGGTQGTWRHYGKYFGDTKGIFIPGTTAHMRYLNGDLVAPEIIELLGKGLETDVGKRVRTKDVLKEVRRIDGSEDRVVNMEL